MKMNGSNRRDTLIGTPSSDTITARGGNDLIATAGGVDTILAGSGDDMITGFSFALKTNTDTDTDDGGGIHIGAKRASSSGSMAVDGGSGGHDIMLVELTAQKGVSEIDSFRDRVAISNVEEFIYNFASLTTDQKILGSNNVRSLETIVVGSGAADIDARSGDDFIYTSDGNDIVNGGNDSDFIHAGAGHNNVLGGAGRDYFHFYLTGTYQYTDIGDFQSGVDKILVTIDVDQVNLLYGTSYESPLPVRGYGDGYQGVGGELNAYASYNYGRHFDPSDFSNSNPALPFADWGFYEEATGSVFVIHYEEHPWGMETETVLVAHVTPGTVIDDSDFSFRMI